MERRRRNAFSFLSPILLHPFSLQYVSIVNLNSKVSNLIFQRHLRQDSGIGRLRLRQILLLRSTEYVFETTYILEHYRT